MSDIAMKHDREIAGIDITSRNVVARSISVRRETLENESRSIEAVLATDSPVLVKEPRTDEVMEEILVMNGAVIPEQVPMLDSHMRSSSDDVRGSIRDIRVEGNELIGRLNFASDDRSAVAWQKVRDGHITDVSAGYTRISWQDVRPGESKEIAGRVYQAGDHYPLRVVTRWRLKESSLTPIGADERAKIMRQESAMPKQQSTDGQRSALGTELFRLVQEQTTDDRPEFVILEAMATASGLEQGTVKDIIGGTIICPSEDTLKAFATALDVSPEALMSFASEDGCEFTSSSEGANGGDTSEPSGGETRADDDPDDEGDEGARAGGAVVTRNHTGARTMPPEETDQLRKQAAQQERQRIARIHQLAGDDIPDQLVTRAIDEEMSVEQAGLVFREHSRNMSPDAASSSPGAPAVHTRERSRTQQELALSAALCTRAGLEPEHMNFDIVQRQHPGEVQRGELPRSQKEQEEWLARAFDDAGRMGRRVTLMDICERAIEVSGHAVPVHEDDIIERAMSTGALANIFTQSVDALVGTPFQEAEDSTRLWCEEIDVENFKEQEDITFGTTAGMSKLARGKKAPHTTIDDAVEKWRIARYAERFVVDEQDIIDDRFDKIRDLSTEMVEDASQLRPNLVYAILLNNPDLVSDGTALFHTDHGNTITDVLSAVAVQTAIELMGKQRRGGRPLNIRARWLVVPQDLRFKSRQILASAERRESDTADGTTNTLRNLGIEDVVDSRLGAAGVVDPDTGAAVAGSATNWFLMANRRTVRVGYRRGTGRRPVVRVKALDDGQWGLGFDINLDIGAYPRDFRGMVRSTGAGG